ncbi:MAG: hypothetical protein M1148_02365 [Candidatus Thermoplasmatota archaeon]|nr:hypothetical protein [Candidatus Thermoplasmatota archaeon]
MKPERISASLRSLEHFIIDALSRKHNSLCMSEVHSKDLMAMPNGRKTNYIFFVPENPQI